MLKWTIGGIIFLLMSTYTGWAQVPESIIWQQLKAVALEENISGEDLAEVVITDNYHSQHNGVGHVYLKQQFRGINLEDARFMLTFGPDGSLVQAKHTFVKSLAKRVNTHIPVLDAQAAVVKVGETHDISIEQRLGEPNISDRVDRRQWFSSPSIAAEPIMAQLSYVSTPDQWVRLAWLVRWTTIDHAHRWNTWVDAINGEVLRSNDWVLKCEFGAPPKTTNPAAYRATSFGQSMLDQAHGHGHSYRPMAGSYRVFPLGIESPREGSRQLLSDPDDPLASPFGWHDTNGQVGPEYTITRGNNVWVLDDPGGDNTGNGYSPDGGVNLLFDFPLDTALTTLDNLDAALTNLFYWSNVLHDISYQYGFDEAGGNFQETNYTGQGEGGDFIIANGQDGSSANNAFFVVSPEGENGRMEIFLFGDVDRTDGFLIISPASVETSYPSEEALFGPGLSGDPIVAEIVLAEDGSGNNEGCQTFTNGSQLNGKIALVDRGTCPFVDKVKNAQAAGALAVIVVNNLNTEIFRMAPFSSEPEAQGVEIPSIMISLADGNDLKAKLLAQPDLEASLSTGQLIGDRDGSLDNVIIAHEYAHGISTRLTGGASEASCLTVAEQAGEGWSDWYGAVLTAKPTDGPATPRPIGYYGFNRSIRPYPYSTDMTVNPMTYDDIKNTNFRVPHDVGSVWGTVLWDLYWALIEEYGYDTDMYDGTGGNNLAMQLVTDGFKLQPCQPGFVDSRDAILLADQLNNNGDNRCLIWEVFARRGLGFSADQGSSTSRFDGQEAFDLPPSCQPVLYMNKVASANEMKLNDTLTYRFDIFNQTANDLSVSIQDNLPELLLYVPNSASCSTTVNQQSLVFEVGTLPAGKSQSCTIKATVNQQLTRGTYLLSEDDLESVTSTNNYVIESDTGSDAWILTSENPRSGNTAFFVPNAPRYNDQRLLVPGFVATDSSVFSFWHNYDTEGGFDGGLIEYRLNNTGGWIDAKERFLQNGYTGNVASNNPAGIKEAFSGNSGGYIHTLLDFRDVSGSTVQVRFRMVSDNNTSEVGWYIDDIGFMNYAVVFNEACINAVSGETWCTDQGEPTLILGDPGVATSVETPTGEIAWEVFPNPAREQVSIRFAEALLGKVEFRLVDPTGKAVLHERRTQVLAGETVQLPVASLAAGVYMLDCRHDEQVYQMKVVVQ